MSEEVIELSINETQALRAKLGLPPLRGVPDNSNSSSSSTSQSSAPRIDNNNNNTATATTNTADEELVLSINETNVLRAKIGLPPLKTNSTSNSSSKAAGSSQSTAIHIVPTNTSATKEAKQRIEDATAKRLNANSIAALEKENSKFDKGKEKESALDFATKMLQSKNSTNGDKESGKEKDDKQKKKKKKRKKKLKSNPQLSLGDQDEEEDEQQASSYTAADLQGIKVSHTKMWIYFKDANHEVSFNFILFV